MFLIRRNDFIYNRSVFIKATREALSSRARSLLAWRDVTLTEDWKSRIETLIDSAQRRGNGELEGETPLDFRNCYRMTKQASPPFPKSITLSLYPRREDPGQITFNLRRWYAWRVHRSHCTAASIRICSVSPSPRDPELFMDQHRKAIHRGKSRYAGDRDGIKINRI